MSKKNNVETLHQQAVIHYLRVQYPHVLFNISPANTVNAYHGKQNKSMGLTAGFPDIFIYHRSGPYAGLAIEMKRPEIRDCEGKIFQTRGTASDSQVAVMEKLNAEGYLAVIAYGARDAENMIDKYLKGGDSQWK